MRSLRGYDRRIGPEEYDELCRRLQRILEEATPADSTIAVVSKGDPKLLELEGRSGLHFPREPDGSYAGYHPKTSEEAIAQVESLIAAGAGYLCVPATALWWLEHYTGLAGWLGANARLAVNDPATCLLYELAAEPASPDTSATAGEILNEQVRALVDALLPEDALLIVIGSPSEGLAAPGRTVASLSTAQELENRWLGSRDSDRPAFVLIAAAGQVDTDPAILDFLDRHTEPVAHREQLCDLLAMRPG